MILTAADDLDNEGRGFCAGLMLATTWPQMSPHAAFGMQPRRRSRCTPRITDLCSMVCRKEEGTYCSISGKSTQDMTYGCDARPQSGWGQSAGSTPVETPASCRSVRMPSVARTLAVVAPTRAAPPWPPQRGSPPLPPAQPPASLPRRTAAAPTFWAPAAWRGAAFVVPRILSVKVH